MTKKFASKAEERRAHPLSEKAAREKARKLQEELIAGPYSNYEIRNVKGEAVEFGFAQVKKLKARALHEGHTLTLLKKED